MQSVPKTLQEYNLSNLGLLPWAGSEFCAHVAICIHRLCYNVYSHGPVANSSYIIARYPPESSPFETLCLPNL